MHLKYLTPEARKMLKAIAPVAAAQGFVLAEGTADDSQN